MKVRSSPAAVARKHRLFGVGLLVVVALAVFLAVKAINGVPLYPYHTVTATFQTASNVVGHDDVRVNGARVGQVLSTTYDPSTSLTKVKMQLQPDAPVYGDAKASVGSISALGAEYITLDPGHKAAGSLGPQGIPLARTTTPVEIDNILDILGPKQADALAATTQTLGTSFGGRGQDLNTVLSTAPTLLPNLGTTTSTLADPQTQLVGLMQASNLLSSRFQGRTQQLSQLLAEMDTTFAALDTQNGQALQSTINDAASTLPVLTPALGDLSSAAGQTAAAVTAVRPGLSALGAGTPDLRVLLRQGVSPLAKVPSVSRQAIPGIDGLATTFSVAHTTQPLDRFLVQLEAQANPLVTYLEPYRIDMTSLWDTLANGLSLGDQNGNWLPFTITVDGRTFNGAPDNALTGRCGYPNPGAATAIRGNASQHTGGCS